MRPRWRGYPRISRCIRQGLAGEVVASSEDIVDFVPAPCAMTRRMARPDSPLQFQTPDPLDALQGAGKDVTLTLVPGAGPRFDQETSGALTPAGQQTAQQVLDWLTARFPKS